MASNNHNVATRLTSAFKIPNIANNHHQELVVARAKEIVVGGMIVLLISAFPTGIPASRVQNGILLDLLGSSLMDMVKEGLLSKDQVDSFNMPINITSLEQIKSFVERNGNLSSERIELMDTTVKHVDPTAKDYALNYRAGMEGNFGEHFGSWILDEVFDRFYKKTVEFFDLLKSSHRRNSIVPCSET